MNNNEYDVILVGSGTCGATIARELSKQNKKVLLLEQGANNPLKETFSGIAAIVKEFVVGKDLKAISAVTVGGATSLFFGVCKLPTSETFAKLGVDLSEEYKEVMQEFTLAELPDEFLPPQSIRIRDSAKEVGYPFKKNLMLIDQSKCSNGSYSYDAKWKAKSYVTEAVNNGTTLIAKADVQKVITENGRAVGVEYKSKEGLGSKLCKAYGKKIVLSAGAFATPKLLINSGINDFGNRGFFVKPGLFVCGTVPGLKGKDAFIGGLDTDLGNGVSIGDGTMNSSLFKFVMLSNAKWGHVFSHSDTVSVGVLLNDAPGGEINENGQYHKRVTEDELTRLKAAEEIAIKILKNAGAENIFSTKLAAGIPGGAIRIKDHLDENMQTKISNLYVCDHSVMCDENITPTITLICLGRYLAKHLAATLEKREAQTAVPLSHAQSI